MNVWVAFKRATFDPSEPDAPDIFAGVYAKRELALEHCWPEGDDRWIREVEVKEPEDMVRRVAERLRVLDGSGWLHIAPWEVHARDLLRVALDEAEK